MISAGNLHERESSFIHSPFVICCQNSSELPDAFGMDEKRQSSERSIIVHSWPFAVRFPKQQ